jgi:hypothetical protein
VGREIETRQGMGLKKLSFFFAAFLHLFNSNKHNNIANYVAKNIIAMH